MFKNFKNPPNKFRIKPFWFLNGELEDDELKRQLFEMKEKGIGGVFICARQGLKIPYLSKKWFEKIKMLCDYATSIGLESWLYDEYPYPSGISGGEVTLRYPEAKQKTLISTIKNVNGGEVFIDLPFAEVLCAVAYKIEGSVDFSKKINLFDDIGNLQRQEIYQKTGLTAYNMKRYFTYEPHKYLSTILPAGSWKLFIVLQKDIENFKYYGTYVDPCNREAIATFIETTHNKYKKYLGESFEGVKGMFSDEVGLLGAIPWTCEAITAMKDKYGYELVDFVPALYFGEYPNAHKIRYEFFDTVHELFKSNYHKQVSDWCTENSIALAIEAPSMRMSTQIYSHIVGGDTAHEKLGVSFRDIVENNLFSYRSNPKSVSSLTRQLDNYFAMIESFHSIGWSMTIQDAKWMIDRLGGFGINFFNFHAYYYTMDSIVKHDAPPSQFIQNAYWKHYRILGDYVGRMGAFVSETDTYAKVAVLDPVATLWMLLSNPFHGFEYRGTDEEERRMCNKIKSYWGGIRKELIYSGMDFDNLDTELLEIAKIRDGKICIGRAEYSVLILPPIISIEAEATNRIKEFVNSGGMLIGIGSIPYIDIDLNDTGKIYQDFFGIGPTDFWNSKKEDIAIVSNGNCHFIIASEDEFSQEAYEIIFNLVDGFLKEDISIDYDSKYARTLLITKRYDKQGNLYIFVSNQEGNDVAITVTAEDNFYFEEYSLEDGSVRQVPSTFYIAPFESKILKYVKGELRPCERTVTEIIIDTSVPMELSIDRENIFRIENFKISTDKKNWYTVEVSTIANQIAASGLADEEKIFEIKSQGFGLPTAINISYPRTVYYRQTFSCEFVPENISLLMDESTILGTFELYINGNMLTKKDFKSVFVNDIKNIKCSIFKLVKTGENEILIKVTVNNDWDGVRDNIYILGDFSVLKNDKSFYMAKPLNTGTIDPHYIKGYPFFCGTFRFKTKLHVEEKEEECRLVLSEKGIYDCVEILADGVSLGVKAFAPYSWTLDNNEKKDYIIEIRITNTLIGMLEGCYFDYEKHKLIKI